MDMRIERHGEKAVVVVSGALNAAVVDGFREQVHAWMKANEKVTQYVIDVSAMDFIDSAGLGVLIALLKRVTERGGDIRIAGLLAKARVVFEITRAFKIFEIYETVEEALRAES
ncbi:MAG TPA: hypothetical protein DCS43_13850 [Verrucomicrobia bacterium]|nr:hypothetical protein [Verrucomicrobiota bacterium]